MNTISCPHDRLFKGAMSDLRVARDFFQHYLPMTFVMKHIHVRDIISIARPFIDMLVALHNKEKENATDFAILLLNYLLSTGQSTHLEDFVALAKEKLSSPIGEKLMTLAEQLIEKGKREGIQTGVSEVLLRQLKLKFGVIAPSHQKLLDEATREDLMKWSERILKVSDLESVFD